MTVMKRSGGLCGCCGLAAMVLWRKKSRAVDSVADVVTKK